MMSTFMPRADKAGTLRAKGLVNSREHLDSLFEVEHLKHATLQQYLNAQPHDHDHGHGHDHAHPHVHHDHAEHDHA